MTAKEINIAKLLEGKKEFSIPIYQRHYSWSKKEIVTLLEDLDTVANKLKSVKEEGSDNKNIDHFLGSIVLLEVSARNSAVQKYSVVDGQQRLTTLFLYVLALHKILKEELDIQLSKHIDTKDEDFIYFCDEWVSNLKGFIFNRNVCKLKSTIEDNEDFFTSVVNGKSISKYSNLLIYKNYSIILSLLKTKVTDNKYKNLRYLVESLSNLITVEVLLKEGEDDPQKVFESLNSTGLGLDQTELIRNYILMKFPNRQEEIYITYWEPIIKNVTVDGKVYAQELFQIIYQLYLGKTLQDRPGKDFKNLYTRYKKELSTKTEEEIEELLIKLKEYSEFILNILALKDFKDEHLTSCIHLCLATSGLSNLATFYSKIYHMYIKDEISKVSLSVIFSEMTNYAVIRTVLKATATSQPPTTYLIANRVLQHIIKNKDCFEEESILSILHKEIAKDNLVNGHNITTERFEMFLDDYSITSSNILISAILAFAELKTAFYKTVSNKLIKTKLTAAKLIDNQIVQKNKLYHLIEQESKIGNYILAKNQSRKELEKDTSYKKYSVNKYIDFDLKDMSKYSKELIELRSRFLSQKIIEVINIDDSEINRYIEESSEFMQFTEVSKELATSIVSVCILKDGKENITTCEYYNDAYKAVINYLFDKFQNKIHQTATVFKLKLRHKGHIDDLSSPERFKNSSDFYFQAGSTAYHLKIIEVIKDLGEEDNILVQLEGKK